jgi:hypothetical protein
VLGFYPLSGAPISGLSPSLAFVSFVSPWRRVLQIQALTADDEESQRRVRRPTPTPPMIISARYVITMIIG